VAEKKNRVDYFSKRRGFKTVKEVCSGDQDDWEREKAGGEFHRKKGNTAKQFKHERGRRVLCFVTITWGGAGKGAEANAVGPKGKNPRTQTRNETGALKKERVLRKSPGKTKK